MAINKKSDYVGNHGGAYVDQNGITKQFTYVDHDIKSKMTTSKVSQEELQTIRESIQAYRESIRNQILAMPASVCPIEFADFTVRGQGAITWNETMVKDEGMETHRLTNLLTLLENRMELMGKVI